MAKTRKFSVKFGGSVNDQYRDSQMSIKYLNMFSNSNIDQNVFQDWKGGKVEDYKVIFDNYASVAPDSSPVVINFKESSSYTLQQYEGLVAVSEEGSKNYSIYRREYEVYDRPWPKIKGYLYNNKFYTAPDHVTEITPRTKTLFIDMSKEDHQWSYEYSDSLQQFILSDRVRIYKGEWEPVIVQSGIGMLYDFNITNGRNYQYILYPSDTYVIDDNDQPEKLYQIFANASSQYRVWKPDSVYASSQGRMIQGGVSTSNQTGCPVSTSWDEWSICELEPMEYDENIAIINNAYTVNTDQIWLFKYSLETGNQTQNITRNDVQTLGQYPKIGFGKSNYISGDVTALLGSEIIPYSKQGYIERLGKSRLSPLSTNEKAKMLEQWRKFVSSKNPKLLKDIKGQSWIVQIIGGSNSPKNLYYQQPDTITFQWKQVADTKNVLIYSKLENLTQVLETEGEDNWSPMFREGKNLEE